MKKSITSLTGNETQEELMKKAKRRSLAILQRMDRTEYQLRTKLKEDGYPQEVIDEAIRYVYSYHYIDDRRYASCYIEQNQMRKSRRMLCQELEKRGISRELIFDCLEEKEDREEEALKALIEKRLRHQALTDEKERQRLFQYCCRRGFSYDSIQKAIKEYTESK